MKGGVKRRRSKASARARPRRARGNRAGAADAPKAVTLTELRALRRELEQRLRTGASRRRSRRPLRWNPEPEDVQRSVAQLVLTLVEFLRRLMERQAIQRMDRGTLTPGEVEGVGTALMELERTIQDIGRRFGLSPEDLNLDLGPLGTLM